MGKKNKKRRHVPVRLNVLFLIVFLLFSALILRLGVVQIVQGEEYERELTQTTNQTARIDAPRGIMYDRFGHTIVDNEMELSVTYTNPSEQSNSEKTKEMLRIANELSTMIDVDTEKITQRDLQDYWYENASKEERDALVDGIDTSEMSNSEEYQTMINQIGDEQLDQYSEEELKVIAIYREMTRGYAGSPQRIKRAVTQEEAHKVSEHLNDLPGVDILRDSIRSYTYGDTFRTILGNTRTIPAEQIDSYLAKGYDRSDLVGVSYLEAQYEDVLRGQKAEINRSSTRNGTTTENTIDEKPGSRGNDLVLTLDMEMQQNLEDIIESTVRANAGSYLDKREAYAIMMNPKTGEIIAMSGFNDDPSNPDGVKVNDTGVINNGFEMGSSVKAASVLTGFETGVMNPNTVINDRPLNVRGTPTKKSVSRMGNVNYLTALERSSNVYMFYIAMRLANHEYQPNAPFRDLTAIRDGYQTARYNFNQFGLGSDPGIDLPSVSTGYQGESSNGGNLMDFFIGQFDTYTPLQAVQYISTVANDGQRMRPHLVSEIREPATNGEEGAIVTQFKPEVLNQVDASKEEIQMVKNGLSRVVYGSNGTAQAMRTGGGGIDKVNFTDQFPDMAAKTGTAEVTVNGRDANNQTLVGYAPADDPEIAFAIVVPGVYTTTKPSIAQKIGSKMLNSYFEINEDRQGPEQVETVLEDVDTDSEVE
ncbi:peptidoglycan D,D-transpeptidase FtsI family protein [Alkalicoccobacillus porphyridii]|uniref:serine-type D-Ala-D-Ala carboxypeptidase n=1 Tax=Alkalicoccobacillus porphyridii TaxID=2597270 RepID=A0A553ZZ55_9BACI|nr:penicillin-binding protein 2 [Alkalicoccobacillus porphyridii]TSB46722.1 penicillin-binding protein 2 [Alkalicoccobacillus porphyridii]